ncbi:MAG: helix-turn-helix domain-containing protein [Xanthomonadaceae bacterium]|nr:helix-turn-helix domain-containing protein [Xanthomonadaceae bacterium]
MKPPDGRSPHLAGSGNSFGGEVPGENSLLARWNLLGAATRDPRLSRGDLAVLHSIAGRIGDDGTAWPGFGRLAADTGLHRSTVERCIDRLEESGYLTRESGGIGKSNRYRLTSRTDATGTSSTDATTTSSAGATGCSDATSRTDATGVVAPTRLGVVAPMRPELDPLNLSNELVQIDLSSDPEKSPFDDRFLEFWKAYPRKDAKQAAEKVWKRKKLSKVAGKIIADVLARVADAGQWTEIKFTPYATTYLNQERWNDEWSPAKQAGAIERDPRSEAELEQANDAEMARFGLGGRA